MLNAEGYECALSLSVPKKGRYNGADFIFCLKKGMRKRNDTVYFK